MTINNKKNIYLLVLLLLYVIVPVPIRILILLLLIILVFKEPENAAIILIVTPIFDIHYVIPYIDRSILLIIFPISIISLILLFKQRKSIVRFLPLLLLFSVYLVYSTIKGYNFLTSYIGFSDPSRGIIFLSSILYLSLLLFSSKAPLLITRLRNKLVLIPLIFLLSIPISIFMYPDYISQMRFQGTFGDPNYFGRFALLSFIISVFSINIKSYKYIAIIAIGSSILFSISRTAFLIFGVFILYFIFIQNIKYKYLYFTLILTTIFVISITSIPDIIFSRFDTSTPIWINNILLDNSLDILTSGRTYLWRYFFEEFNFKNPIFYFGGGVGYSSSFFLPLFGEAIVAHNSFLEVLLDAGIIGFILLFYILFKLAKVLPIIGIKLAPHFPYLLITFLVYNSTLSGFWVKQNIAIIFLILISYGTRK